MNGNVEESAELLGRYHEVYGTVTHGKGDGKKLGFPTVNLTDVGVIIPKKGIYAAWHDVGDSTQMAAVYIGDRPTLGHWRFK